MKRVIRVKVKGKLYKRIHPGEYYFLEHEDHLGVEDRIIGELARKLGYKVRDSVELEVIVKRKKN